MSEIQPPPEHLQVDFQYASFWNRFVALFIDILILLIPMMIINHIAPLFGTVVVFLFYKPIFESSPLLATPGKSLMGIVVVSEQGNRLTYKQALIRCLMSFASMLFLCLGYLMSLFTGRHQALHDLLAGSIVINQEMPKENYFDIWLNEMRSVFGRGTDVFGSSNQTRAGGANPSGMAGKAKDSSAVEALSQLHKLYTEGVLTEAEYLAKKAELLKRI